jgi:hypothetical protein
MEKLLFPIVNAALRVAGYDCIYSWSEFSAQIEGRLSSPRAFDFRIEDQRQETWRKIMRHPGAKTALAKLTHRLGHLVAHRYCNRNQQGYVAPLSTSGRCFTI